jgi:tetratricopeptide (TPR) repeat protein
LQLAGEAWALLGDYEEARPLLTRALRHALNHPETDYATLRQLANLLAEMGGLILLSSAERDRLIERAERQHDRETALRWLQTLLQHADHPQRPEILLQYARLLERAGQPQQAKQALRELQERYPDSLQADLARLHKRD